MPRYNRTVEQNQKLTEQMETMQVKMNTARQEKLSALHKLKMREIELEELYARGSTSQKRPRMTIDPKFTETQEKKLKDYYEAQLASLSERLQIQTKEA